MYLPDNEHYIQFHIEALVATGTKKVDALKTMYEKTKSSLVFRTLIEALDSSTDIESFKLLVRADFIKAVRKILPSYFQSIKELYQCSIKTKAFESILLESIEQLEKNNRFDGETKEETPHSMMFVMYLLSHHYKEIGQLDKALEYCEKTEEYCPTFVEVYILKAKIYKKLGRYELAAKTLKETHTIDKADRYLTNITAKYLLLNNQIQEGDECFKSFVYQAAQVEKSIHNLQKSFYEIWLGKAYIRQRKWGRGLRQFKFVYQHINEIIEDQLEFFQYMLRKTSLVSLVEVVKFNTQTFMSDFRLVRGLGYLLKYGIRHLRNIPVEEGKIKAIVAADPTEDEKKLKKALEKRDRTGVITCDKELAEELDLEGKKTLEAGGLPLAQAAQMLFKTQTDDPALKRLAWSSLFDYYLHNSKIELQIEKVYCAIRCIIKLSELNLTEPAYLMRKALLSWMCKIEVISE